MLPGPQIGIKMNMLSLQVKLSQQAAQASSFITPQKAAIKVSNTVCLHDKDSTRRRLPHTQSERPWHRWVRWHGTCPRAIHEHGGPLCSVEKHVDVQGPPLWMTTGCHVSTAAAHGGRGPSCRRGGH